MINKTLQILESGISPFIIRDMVTVDANAPVDLAIQQYRSSPYKAVLVVDATTRKLTGIITDWDLAKLYEKETPANAGGLANKTVIAVRQDAQLWQLLKIMNGENDMRRNLDVVPVVDDQSRPIGLIRRERLTDALAQLESGSMRQF